MMLFQDPRTMTPDELKDLKAHARQIHDAICHYTDHTAPETFEEIFGEGPILGIGSTVNLEACRICSISSRLTDVIRAIEERRDLEMIDKQLREIWMLAEIV